MLHLKEHHEIVCSQGTTTLGVGDVCGGYFLNVLFSLLLSRDLAGAEHWFFHPRHATGFIYSEQDLKVSGVGCARRNTARTRKDIRFYIYIYISLSREL